jgi:dTDP-alpha-D-glucose dehydrogenase
MRFLQDGTIRPRVAIVGFGYVGSCLAAVLASRGLEVLGVDSNRRLVDKILGDGCPFNEPGLAEGLRRARESGLLTISSEYESIRQAEVILITVGTPVDGNRQIAAEQLEAACKQLASQLSPGQLVILKSTVAPGVTSQLVRPLLEVGGLVQGRDFGLAFCPERLAEGHALADLATLPIVVGGCDADSTEAACRFWAGALGVSVIPYGRPEITELIKLADNWWIDVNIAIAGELAQLCGTLGIDVLDVISGANSLPKGDSHVNILMPGVGVGGSCLTKDPWILWSAGRERGVRFRMVEAARQVNDEMPHYTFRLIREQLAALGIGLSKAKVAVLGIAFKNNTNDLRNTPVKPVVTALREAQAEVTLYDPLVDAKTALDEFGLQPADRMEDAVSGAHCVAVLAGHDQLRNLDFRELASLVTRPCLLVDGRACYPRDVIDQMREFGFIYRGIGR